MNVHYKIDWKVANPEHKFLYRSYTDCYLDILTSERKREELKKMLFKECNRRYWKRKEELYHEEFPYAPTLDCEVHEIMNREIIASIYIFLNEHGYSIVDYRNWIDARIKQFDIHVDWDNAPETDIMMDLQELLNVIQ